MLSTQLNELFDSLQSNAFSNHRSEIQKSIPRCSYEVIDADTNKIDDLKCCVCLEIVNDPVTHVKIQSFGNQCGQCFCRECLKQCSKCPLCRQPLGDAFNAHVVCVPKLIQKQIDSLDVKCLQCKLEFTLGTFSNHYNNCCQCTCPNTDCSFEGSRRQLLSHQNECEFQSTECSLKRYGCNWTGLLKERDTHTKTNCKYVHMHRQVVKLETQISAHKYEASRLEIQLRRCNLDRKELMSSFLKRVRKGDKLYVRHDDQWKHLKILKKIRTKLHFCDDDLNIIVKDTRSLQEFSMSFPGV